MYEHLLGLHEAVTRSARPDLAGHKTPCEEIADLVARFPAYRAWTSTLVCAAGPAPERRVRTDIPPEM
jgi:hypothetical protein